MARLVHVPHKPGPRTVVNLGTLGLLVAWAAAACYALAYLLSH